MPIKHCFFLLSIAVPALLPGVRAQEGVGGNFDCVDTIQDHPVCLFGSICDCVELTSSPDNTCGSTMTSAGQSVEVNEICSQTCDACEEEAPADKDPDCVNIIADHPVCLFGSICDCEELTSSPEYPCGSTMTSAGQSVDVNELCAETCEACDKGEGTVVTVACEDELADHPLCLFAQLCSCETDILSAYSCDGAISSPQGSVQVADVCAKSCNATCTSVQESNDEPEFAGPVYGHLPMGIIDGQRSDVYYTVVQDKVDFVMHFPDTSAWVAFQFWGGDFRGITDGRLPQATSGFECLVDDKIATASDSDEKASRVHCRARRVRHLFTSFSDLPGSTGDMINMYSVTSCNENRALAVTASGVPFCNYDPLDVRNSSLIISSSDRTSELVFVTDMLPDYMGDMLDIDVVHHAENGTFTARWSRSRGYPWGLSGDGTTLNVRWAVSPRGASGWVEGDLAYHGSFAYQRWHKGSDFLFMDSEAQAAHDRKYMAEINANTHRFGEEELEARLKMFRAAPEQDATPTETLDEDIMVLENTATEAPVDDAEDESAGFSMATSIFVLAALVVVVIPTMFVF